MSHPPLPTHGVSLHLVAALTQQGRHRSCNIGMPEVLSIGYAVLSP